MENNIVKLEGNNIIIAKDICFKMRELNIAKKKLEELENEVKFELLEAMAKNGIKSLENDYFKATYIAPTTRKTFDSKALKVCQPDIYELYASETTTSDSVRITYKGDK